MVLHQNGQEAEHTAMIGCRRPAALGRITGSPTRNGGTDVWLALCARPDITEPLNENNRAPFLNCKMTRMESLLGDEI